MFVYVCYIFTYYVQYTYTYTYLYEIYCKKLYIGKWIYVLLILLDTKL